jgi:site-specific recombinase XerD
MPNLATPTGLRDRVMLELLHRHGLRATELCELHLRDVHARELELHLRPEITKLSNEAVLPLEPRTLEWIERWKPIRRQYAAGRGCSSASARARAGRAARSPRPLQDDRARARKAGIRKTSPHVLRHTYASDLLREGFSIEEVRRLMRHASIRTTGIYLEVHDAQLSERLRRRG